MSTEINGNLELAYGEVVNVRNIPSRGVTRIEIEIPIDFHVPATAMLFNKRAIVLPWQLDGIRVTYGIHKLSDFYAKPPAETTSTRSRSMFGTASPKNYVGLAHSLCREPGFWKILEQATASPVENEAAAAHALRAYLQITSRAELSINRQAQHEMESLQGQFRAATMTQARAA